MATPRPPLPANAHLSEHPCLRAKLSQLRSHSTGARETKLLIHDIATIVGCEALAACVEAVEDGTVCVAVSDITCPPVSLTSRPASIMLAPPKRLLMLH